MVGNLFGNSPAKRQRGDVLLLVLVVLVVLILGFTYSLRHVILDTQMAGNNLARQKAVQVADVALRNFGTQLLPYNQPLEIVAINKTWFRDVVAGTAPPSGSYWKNCNGNGSTALRCAAVNVAIGASNLPYTALVVLQPTGRTGSCSSTVTPNALYYDIFVYASETSAASAVTTETVYKLCTP